MVYIFTFAGHFLNDNSPKTRSASRDRFASSVLRLDVQEQVWPIDSPDCLLSMLYVTHMLRKKSPVGHESTSSSSYFVYERLQSVVLKVKMVKT